MKTTKNRHFWFLVKYMKPHRMKIVFMILLLALSITIQLINPGIIKYFIDSATSKKDMSRLTAAALIFIGMAVLNQLIVMSTTYLSQNIGWEATNSLRIDLVEHCLGLDMSFHKNYKPGEIIERIDGDVMALFNFFSKLLIQLINNLILIVGVLGILFVENFSVGAAITVFAVVALATLWKLQKGSIPYHTKERQNSGEFYGFLGENIQSREDIRANGAVSSTMNKLHKELRKRFQIHKNAVMRYCIMWTTTLALFAVGSVISLGMGALLWSKGIITIGTVYLIFSYTEMLNRPIEQIRRQLMDLQKATAGIMRVEELLQIKSMIEDGYGQEISSKEIEIEFDNVSFSYDKGNPVLKDVTFKLPKGKVLGVLGKTGSGKTTLARLLMRFYDAETGTLKLNNQDISEVPLNSLRENIGFVTQDVQLFHATLRDNLTFFNKNITDEELLDIIHDIGLEKWLRTLPKGLDTVIDSQGGGLSLGECQLLAFGRVFLKNPSIVILDEASSRLDPITEHLMEQAVTKLLKHRTCLIIAHRLNTIKQADYILILEEGKISEFGLREELETNLHSKFNKLLKIGMEEVLL